MRSGRRLVLRKEALTELRTDELTVVVGAAATTPVGYCVTEVLSKVVECDSIRPCVSHTCTR